MTVTPETSPVCVGLKLMAWPLQSPDLDLIELVWGELDREVN